MVEKRFVLPAMLSILFIILAFILSIIPIIGEKDLSYDLIPIIPGNIIIDVTFAVFIPYLFLIVWLYLGPIIAPGFVKLHKLIKLNKYDYFITTTDKKRSGVRILARSILPGMLAVNIAIYITLYGGINNIILIDGSLPNNIPSVIEYASILIGIPIASFIIIPLWMIQTSGLMGSKRMESYNHPVSPDIESVPQFYIKLLKGFAGISFIITYSLILYQYFTTADFSGSYSPILVVFLDPILIILYSLPIALIMELREEKIKAKMQKYLEKMKINTIPKIIKIE